MAAKCGDRIAGKRDRRLNAVFARDFAGDLAPARRSSYNQTTTRLMNSAGKQGRRNDV